MRLRSWDLRVLGRLGRLERPRIANLEAVGEPMETIMATLITVVAVGAVEAAGGVTVIVKTGTPIRTRTGSRTQILEATLEAAEGAHQAAMMVAKTMVAGLVVVGALKIIIQARRMITKMVSQKAEVVVITIRSVA